MGCQGEGEKKPSMTKEKKNTLKDRKKEAKLGELTGFVKFAFTESKRTAGSKVERSSTGGGWFDLWGGGGVSRSKLVLRRGWVGQGEKGGGGEVKGTHTRLQ